MYIKMLTKNWELHSSNFTHKLKGDEYTFYIAVSEYESISMIEDHFLDPLEPTIEELALFCLEYGDESSDGWAEQRALARALPNAFSLLKGG